MSPTRPDGSRRRSATRRGARYAVLGVLVLLSTTACDSSDLPRLGWPSGAVEQTQRSLWLWQTAWIAAFIVGGITLILILFPAVFHRRSRMGEVPVQTRYNLPIEIFYTIVPLIIVAVLFGYTARDEAQITKLAPVTPNTVNVVAFQWSWTFNYVDQGTYDVGTPNDPPTLWLPVNEKTRFELTSPDVIHSFWVPDFLFKMDVIPGRTNQFDLTPDKLGTFKGKCAELCGVDHSRMLFNVNVVTADQYAAHIASLRASGRNGVLENGRVDNNAQGKQGRTEINRNPNEPIPRIDGDGGRAEWEQPVTLLNEPAAVTAGTARVQPETPRKPLGKIVVSWITSTDHKTIGFMYLITSFCFFILAGAMAMLMRAELARPGLQFVTTEQYNQLFTMHGTIMLLLFATPLFIGFANVIMPLQIGSPDVAFPRLNMLSYWLFLFGGLIVVSGFLTSGGAASFGWFAYSPLNSVVTSPGAGSDMWIMGLAMGGFGTILGAVNFITTIFCLRAPGMTMFRMPIFTWNILLTSVLVLLAFPILAAALLVLEIDRKLGAHIFDSSNGGPLLWQHLFWFFGHPEVYIIALPFFGIVSEILPVFSRKPIFGYKGLVFATLGIAALSVAVWAHHMYVTGGVLLPFFAFMTMLIAVPTGVKFFNWIGTMWRGSLSFETPMLWSIGFLITFLFGGLTGVLLAAPPIDFHVSDSYFVVAHFHYVVFGTVVFAMFGGFYFWWPKMTGRMLDERLGKVHFWTLFIGFHSTFLVQHWLGVEGMPRRYADYLPSDHFTFLNTFSTVGSFVLGASTIPFIYNVIKTSRGPRTVFVDDPWGWGRSLEWATSCPPPRHNFTALPRIRSESPAFDLHHPELAPHAAHTPLPVATIDPEVATP